MHAYGRCKPMTPESHAYDADEVHAYACLWEMHACGRCTSMRDARLEDEHLWDTRLWEMHACYKYQLLSYLPFSIFSFTSIMHRTVSSFHYIYHTLHGCS